MKRRTRLVFTYMLNKVSTTRELDAVQHADAVRLWLTTYEVNKSIGRI